MDLVSESYKMRGGCLMSNSSLQKNVLFGTNPTRNSTTEYITGFETDFFFPTTQCNIFMKNTV